MYKEKCSGLFSLRDEYVCFNGIIFKLDCLKFFEINIGFIYYQDMGIVVIKDDLDVRYSVNKFRRSFVPHC